MAEVVDIIHKLTYEANTSVIEQVNDEFGEQVQLIQQSQAKIAKYQEQMNRLAATGKANHGAFISLIKREQQEVNRLTEAIGRQVVGNKQLSNSVVDVAGKLKNLRFATSQLVREAPAFAFSFQTGLVGISNNIPIFIDQLNAARAAGVSTKQALIAVGASFLSITSVLSIAIPLLTQFAGSLFSSAEAAKEANDEYKEFIKTLQQTSKGALNNIDEQINKLKLLKGVIDSNSKASKGAFEQLKNDYPQILKNIENENQLRSNPQIFNEIEKQIRAKERSNAASRAIVDTQEQERLAGLQIEAVQKRLNVALKDEEAIRKRVGELRKRGGVVDQDNPLNRLLLQAESRTNFLRAVLDSTKLFADNLSETREKLQKDSLDEALKASDILFVEQEKKDKKKQDRDKRFIEKLDEFRDITPLAAFLAINSPGCDWP